MKAEAPITLGDLPFSDNRYTLEWEQKDDSENWLDPAHNPYTSRVTMRWEREETRQPGEARGDLKCDAAGVDLVVYLPDGSTLPEAEEQEPGSGVFVLLNQGEPTGSTLGPDQQATVVPRMVHLKVRLSSEDLQQLSQLPETSYLELEARCSGIGGIKVWKKLLTGIGAMHVLLAGNGTRHWRFNNLEELAELAAILLHGLWVEGTGAASSALVDWSLELRLRASEQNRETRDLVQGTTVGVEIKATSVVPSPTGCLPTYDGSPREGSADNLLAVWPDEGIIVRVDIRPEAMVGSMPEGYITWTVPDHDVEDNSLEATLSWPAPFLSIVGISFPKLGLFRMVHIDLPYVGELTEEQAIFDVPLWPGGLILGYGVEARFYVNARFTRGHAKWDATQHALWNALCVSDGDIQTDWVEHITRAHEYDNKYPPPGSGRIKDRALNSSMDLFNNEVGRTVLHSLLDKPNRFAIWADLEAKYAAGELRIWRNEWEAQSEGILVKSNGEKIFQ